MSSFTHAELRYLAEQLLGRLATLSADGAPQTRPVGFVYNPELDTIDIGGHNMGTSRKYRNIQTDARVSFVVDDLASTEPWRPRGVEVRGRAEAVAADQPGHELIRIYPERVLGWGLDSDAFAPPHARTVSGADKTPSSTPESRTAADDRAAPDLSGQDGRGSSR